MEFTLKNYEEDVAIVSFEEFRSELTAPTAWGQESPVKTEHDVIERRKGRLIPSVEASLDDFGRLERLSQFMAEQAEALIILNRLNIFIPAPEQLERVSFDQSQGCWTLPVSESAEKRQDFYGRMRVRNIPNISGLAHRTMYKVYFGLDSLPNGRMDYLDHLCEAKECCNPRHVEKVTHKENTRRGRVKDSNLEQLF